MASPPAARSKLPRRPMTHMSDVITPMEMSCAIPSGMESCTRFARSDVQLVLILPPELVIFKGTKETLSNKK